MGGRRPREDPVAGGPGAVRDRGLSERGRFDRSADADRGRAVFIAAPLSAEAKAAVAAVVQRVQERSPGTRPGAPAGERAVRWVRMDGLHLTLRYIGPVPEASRGPLIDATRRAARRCEPFDVELVTAGAFPNPRRPRTLWLAAGPGADDLARLNGIVDDGVEGAGFGRDSRPFRPHLTLARADGVGGGAETARILVEEAAGLAVRWRVVDLVLFESVTGGGPARYVPIEVAPLAGDAG